MVCEYINYGNEVDKSGATAQCMLGIFVLQAKDTLFRSDGLLAASCEMSTQQSLEK